MRTPTPSDITIEDISYALSQYGIKEVRRRGSHIIFEKTGGQQYHQLVIPLSGKHIKKAYVREVHNLIVRMKGEEEK